jgi:hypothetical protein
VFVNTKKPETDYSKELGMSALRIAMSYVDGYSSLKFLFEILEVQKNDIDKFITFSQFFNYLYGVCYQSVVINLSNIFVEDKESINIYYLDSLLEKQFNDNKDWENYSDLHTSIQKISESYSKKSDFYIGLKELRDKYIAHIDKIRFHSATGLSKKISLNDLELAYSSIGNLVGKLIGILGINPELIDFDQLGKANLQFRLLINDLKTNLINISK